MSPLEEPVRSWKRAGSVLGAALSGCLLGAVAGGCLLTAFFFHFLAHRLGPAYSASGPAAFGIMVTVPLGAVVGAPLGALLAAITGPLFFAVKPPAYQRLAERAPFGAAGLMGPLLALLAVALFVGLFCLLGLELQGGVSQETSPSGSAP
jgi:hypothetical protein